MLVFPFRELNDLKEIHCGSYWKKFITMRDSGILTKDGLKILQNISDQIQCKN